MRACQANQRTIEGAVSTYAASSEGVPADVAGLVDENNRLIGTDAFIMDAPLCEGEYYTLDANGTVTCPNGHPHY